MNSGDRIKSASTKLTTPQCIRTEGATFRSWDGDMMANVLSISVLEIISQATDAISHTRSQPCVDIQATGQGPVHAWQARATYDGRPAKANVIRKAKGGDASEAKQKEKPTKCPFPSPHSCAGRSRRRGPAVKKPNSGGLCRLGSPRRAAPVDRTRRHPPAQRLRRGENPAPLVPTPLCGEAAKKGLGGQEAQETEAGK